MQGSRLTRSELVIEDNTTLRCNPIHQVHKIHSGIFDSSKIAIHVISLRNKNSKDFVKLKSTLMEKDKSLIDSLTPHPRIIRYLGTYFNSGKLEACLITDFFAGCTMEVSIKSF